MLPKDSIVFHGFVDSQTLSQLMQKSSGFVFPSAYETFGCVLMEAMACGCPVLTTKVGGIPAVVRDGEGLFVKVGDIKAIANGMVKLIDDTHHIDMNKIGRDVRERFNHQAVGGILHDIHKEVIMEKSVFSM